jgi:membrane protein implicated in regulation of membrane protease activity
MLHVFLFCAAFGAVWALVPAGAESPEAPVRRPPAVAAPVAGFGVAGLGALGAGAATGVQVALAAAVALVVAWAVAAVRRPDAEASGLRTGRVTVGIPPGGVGEIGWSRGSEHGTALARSVDGEPLPGGTEVRVVGVDAGGVVVARVADTLLPVPARAGNE